MTIIRLLGRKNDHKDWNFFSHLERVRLQIVPTASSVMSIGPWHLGKSYFYRLLWEKNVDILAIAYFLSEQLRRSPLSYIAKAAQYLLKD